MAVLDPTGWPEGHRLWSSETHKKLLSRNMYYQFCLPVFLPRGYWASPPTVLCPHWQPQQWKDAAVFNPQLSRCSLDFNQEERVCAILELATSHNKPKQKPGKSRAWAGAKRAIARGNGLLSVSNNWLKGCHAFPAGHTGISGGPYKGKVDLKGLGINQLRNNFALWWPGNNALAHRWAAGEHFGCLHYSQNSKHHMK